MQLWFLNKIPLISHMSPTFFKKWDINPTLYTQPCFNFPLFLVACSNGLKQNIENKIEPQHTPQIVTNTIHPLYQ